MDNTNLPPVQVPHRESGSRDEGSPVETKRPGSKAQGHKRTKTGCLTCRKRRIKCGEERPACQNCVKSKRQCAGYNQRVVFKDPINVYRGPQGSSAHVSFSQHSFKVNQGESSQKPLPAPRAPPITPKAAGSAFSSAPRPSLTTTETPLVEQGASKSNAEGDTTAAPSEPSQLNNDPSSINHANLQARRSEKAPQHDRTYQYSSTFDTRPHGSSDPQHTAPESMEMELSGWSGGPPSASPTFPDDIFFDSNARYPATAMPRQLYPSQPGWANADGSSKSFSTPFSTYGAYDAPFSAPGPVSEVGLTPQQPQEHLQTWDGKQVTGYAKVGQDARENIEPVPAPVDLDSDDPFDVSDEDDDYDTDDSAGVLQGMSGDSCTVDNELGVIVSAQTAHVGQDLSLRSITSFINRPNMLSTYTPSHRSSPLNDAMTSRIFSHFINVTAATISMFERNPANPSLIFQRTPVPRFQQHVWTYTVPSLALRNDGLLHAILALAALHIAKLQDDHITASLKHYSISLRRIAKSVIHPIRRNRPATLAASLLLACYECWGADHQKWSNHILGAKMLIKEIDFAGMTKYLNAMKLKQRQEEEAQNFPGMQQTFGSIHEDYSLYQRANEDVDENIVGMLMGKRVQYDQYGQILDDDSADFQGRKSYTRRQLLDYETQQDLFWWYCKMDAYHSIIGGGRLFLEYDRWSHCPPRAPLGRLSASYGTYDHVMLVIGRVANFAAKDLKRKRLAWKANQERQSPEAAKMPGPPQPPMFSGMMPVTGEPKLPMGFQEPFGDTNTQQHQADFIDLEAKRIEAEEEWHDIMNAFSILEDHFGEDFQALGPEFSRPVDSPFGPALQYRTYSIAGIWLNYYMALIVCHRAHPSMPPVAMMAAGMAAKQTAFFANQLGRVAAGIAPYSTGAAQVTPGVGAALIETSFCLFIAGVQYQEHGHRMWTINRLLDIARLTGWQSSHSVIAGCEGSWTKLAQLGRGPPYTRTSDRKPPVHMSDEEIRRSRRIDKALREMSEGDTKIVVHETDRAHYAIGLLGFEDDFDKMVLENEEGEK